MKRCSKIIVIVSCLISILLCFAVPASAGSATMASYYTLESCTFNENTLIDWGTYQLSENNLSFGFGLDDSGTNIIANEIALSFNYKQEMQIGKYLTFSLGLANNLTNTYINRLVTSVKYNFYDRSNLIYSYVGIGSNRWKTFSYSDTLSQTLSAPRLEILISFSSFIADPLDTHILKFKDDPVFFVGDKKDAPLYQGATEDDNNVASNYEDTQTEVFDSVKGQIDEIEGYYSGFDINDFTKDLSGIFAVMISIVPADSLIYRIFRISLIIGMFVVLLNLVPSLISKAKNRSSKGDGHK